VQPRGDCDGYLTTKKKAEFILSGEEVRDKKKNNEGGDNPGKVNEGKEEVGAILNCIERGTIKRKKINSTCGSQAMD